MKKKLLSLMLVAVVAIGLTACGGSGSSEDTASNEPLDLTGTWTQTNRNSEDMYQEATISKDAMEIYWVSDNGETKDLYWAGTFTAPTEATDECSWTSENDTEKTEMALLASTGATKEFTYKDGEITYEVSAMGSTTTVTLEKQE